MGEREILLGLKSCLWASALHSFYENIRCIIEVFLIKFSWKELKSIIDDIVIIVRYFKNLNMNGLGIW